MVVKKKSSKKTSEKSLKKVTGDMTIREVMQMKPEAVGKLLSMGMGCCGCRFAMVETLEQGCAVHGLDLKKVLKELND